MLAETYEVHGVWPTNADQVREEAAEAAADTFDLAVAFGGDGVVHHVANGIVGTTTGLGIIPAGTTNVLSRILRLPRRPVDAARFLAAHPPLRAVPVAKAIVNSPAGARNAHALFAFGMGFDAEVVAQAEMTPARKLRFGALHYARSAAWVLWSRFRDRLPHLRVEADGRRADGVAALVQVHWPYTYFGRLPLRLTRRARPGLAVMVVERLRLLRVPGLLLRAVRGRNLDKVPGVEVWADCRTLEVEAEPAAWMQGDGELLGLTERVEVSYLADSLRVAAPQVD